MIDRLTFFDPPPVRYMGAKWQLAKWIISHFPPHTIYVEPFCGSAAIFFRKERSQIEVLNDLNGDLVHFFHTLRSDPDALINQIELTPFALEEYELSWERTDDPLERARRFYVRSWQSFSGDTSTRSGWRRVLATSREMAVTQDWRRLEGLRKAVDLLRYAQIDCIPALDCIQKYDNPNALFYLDPPYVHETRKSMRHKYVHEMTDDDHRALAEVLHQVKGMVLLSGYDSDLYRELYPDWQRLSKSNTTNGNGVATEYLWLSPNAVTLENLPLFRHEPL